MLSSRRPCLLKGARALSQYTYDSVVIVEGLICRTFLPPIPPSRQEAHRLWIRLQPPESASQGVAPLWSTGEPQHRGERVCPLPVDDPAVVLFVSDSGERDAYAYHVQSPPD